METTDKNGRDIKVGDYVKVINRITGSVEDSGKISKIDGRQVQVAVFATKFHTTTNNSTSSGFYSFYDENTLVACYPIEKTIISSIDQIEENDGF